MFIQNLLRGNLSVGKWNSEKKIAEIEIEKVCSHKLLLGLISSCISGSQLEINASPQNRSCAPPLKQELCIPPKTGVVHPP